MYYVLHNKSKTFIITNKKSNKIVDSASLRRLPWMGGLTQRPCRAFGAAGVSHFRAFKSKLLTPSNRKPRHFVSGSLCPRLDSNQHAVSSTTTSRWLVYQFQHPGAFLIGCNIKLFFLHPFGYFNTQYFHSVFNCCCR